VIDANVYNWLKAEATIIAITTASRIYPLVMPEKPTYPCITYRDANHDVDNTFDGSSGFCRSDYYIDAWHTDHAAADVLANTIKDALKDLTGAFGGITVFQIFFTVRTPAIFEPEVEAYRITQMFSIWHGEV